MTGNSLDRSMADLVGSTRVPGRLVPPQNWIMSFTRAHRD